MRTKGTEEKLQIFIQEEFFLKRKQENLSQS